MVDKKSNISETYGEREKFTQKIDYVFSYENKIKHFLSENFAN